MESFWQRQKQKAAKNKNKKKCNLAAHFIMEPCERTDEAGIENGWRDFIMETCGLHLLRQLILYAEVSFVRGGLFC